MPTGTQCQKLTNVFDQNRVLHNKTLRQILTDKIYSIFLQKTAFQIKHTSYIGHIIVIASHQGLSISGKQSFSVVTPLYQGFPFEFL